MMVTMEHWVFIETIEFVIDENLSNKKRWNSSLFNKMDNKGQQSYSKSGDQKHVRTKFCTWEKDVRQGKINILLENVIMRWRGGKREITLSPSWRVYLWSIWVECRWRRGNGKFWTFFYRLIIPVEQTSKE